MSRPSEHSNPFVFFPRTKRKPRRLAHALRKTSLLFCIPLAVLNFFVIS